MLTNKKLTLMLLLLAWTSNGYGQDSNIPASVRAMIERSQAGNQVEQTARMQMDMQFGDFIAALDRDQHGKDQVEAAFVEVLSERVRLSSQVTSGQATTAQLAAVADYAYLRARLEQLLNAAELTELDSRRGRFSDAQLKRDYAEELSRTASDLSEEDRELVLNTLIKHMRVAEGEAVGLSQLSVEDLVNQQSQSLMQVRQELQSLLNGEQLQQVNGFINQLQSNLFMNRSMSNEIQ